MLRTFFKRPFPLLCLICCITFSAGALAQEFNKAIVLSPGGTFSSWGDYDNDGDLDLFITGGYEEGVQYTNVFNNDCGFTNINAGMLGLYWASGAWGDYDNDNDLDLIVMGDNEEIHHTTLYNNNGGAFTEVVTGFTPLRMGTAAWGDYDNDGDPDLLLIGQRGGHGSSDNVAQLYRNDGGGVFVDINAGLTGARGSAAAWGDYDNDGDLDLIVAGTTDWDLTAATILYNNEAGIFTEITDGFADVHGACLSWGDYDSDGDLDLFLSGLSYDAGGTIARVYQNNAGTFTDINAGLIGLAGATGSGAWGDYDNDGDLDLVFGGSYDNLTKLYRNDNGVFVDTGIPFDGLAVGSVAWGDYDRDGDLDILLAGTLGSGYTSFAEIYRNDCVSTGLLTNSGFESGTSPWVFYTNGTGGLSLVAPGPSSPNAARVAITTTGNNMQLYQAGITLQPNTQYRLKFKALSSVGHNLSVSLARHVAPFTKYGLNNHLFDITSSWATYTVDFTTVGFPPPTPSNGRLRFTFNGYASPGDVYYIDDVSLVQLGSPLTATKVRAETAPDGGGSVVPTQTIENGESITMYAISRTATDQFVANVSATWSLTDVAGGIVAGDLVVSGNGKSAVFTGHADGATRVQAACGPLTAIASQVITVFTPPPVTNLLLNGGFESGTTNWLFNTNGAGSFTAVTPGNVGAKAGQVSINIQGAVVQLYQFGLSLTSGNTYRVSFRAFSNTGHDVQVSVFKHGVPFTPYGLTSQFFNLTNTWASYSVDFTASGFAGTVGDARLRFWFASYDVAGDIYQFDDIKLELVPAPPQSEIHNPQSEIPAEFALAQNYPNPFNPLTIVNYQLPINSYVTLKVYDVLGQEVTVLVDEIQNAGFKSVEFDASNLSSGVYLYRIQAGDFAATRKLVVVK